jgi:hypothetical protein
VLTVVCIAVGGWIAITLVVLAICRAAARNDRGEESRPVVRWRGDRID